MNALKHTCIHTYVGRIKIEAKSRQKIKERKWNLIDKDDTLIVKLLDDHVTYSGLSGSSASRNACTRSNILMHVWRKVRTCIYVCIYTDKERVVMMRRMRGGGGGRRETVGGRGIRRRTATVYAEAGEMGPGGTLHHVLVHCLASLFFCFRPLFKSTLFDYWSLIYWHRGSNNMYSILILYSILLVYK